MAAGWCSTETLVSWRFGRLRRRRRLLIVLENTGNLAKNAFFLLVGLGLRVGPGRRLRLSVTQAKNPRQHSFNSGVLVASIRGLSTRNECGCVGLRAGGRRQ